MNTIPDHLPEIAPPVGPAAPTTEESSVVPPPALSSFIATRDRKIAKFWPHAPNHLRETFELLIERGAVRVGGRSSCSGSDPTMTAFRYWNEVVKKARTLGFDIEQADVPGQRNAWATRAGGFWNESEYRLIRTGAAE